MISILNDKPTYRAARLGYTPRIQMLSTLYRKHMALKSTFSPTPQKSQIEAIQLLAYRFIIVFILISVTTGTEAQEWSLVRPILKSEVQLLTQSQAVSVLANLCQDKPIYQNSGRSSFHCLVRNIGSAFADMNEQFDGRGVIFGHFVAANSEDALISGWNGEGHGNRFGGTLLVTKRSEQWVPLWYKSALITHSCQKVALPDNRDVLVCEDEDGGMGHRLHYLYMVDPRKTPNLAERMLGTADSFDESCAVQTQVMQPIEWSLNKSAFSVVISTIDFRRRPDPACSYGPQELRPPIRMVTRFIVTDQGIQPVKSK